MELQEFKAAARCIAKGFCTMHIVIIVMYGQPMPIGKTTADNQKLWWLILPLLGPLDTCPPIQLQKLDSLGISIEHSEHGPLMSHARAYTQYCDMHLMGFMLSEVSKELPWGSNSKDICQVLQSKQLTAS